MKKVSLADVAQSLNLSKTLVSLVLNDKGDEYGINAEAQVRVREKAKELNYFPNQIAKTLRTKRSNTIGLIVTDISNPFYSKIARAIEQEALKNGYHLICSSSEEDEQQETQLIHLLKDRQQADGLIIATTQQDSTYLAQIKEQGYPFVLIDRYLPNFEANTVCVDNYRGAFAMVEYLINKGRKDIGLLSLAPSHISTISDRVKGYRDALVENKISIREELIQEVQFVDFKEGVKDALTKMLDNKKTRPNAIFALNNHLAIAAIEYLIENKVKMPDDIMVVSFDDVDTFKLINPQITAIAQPTETIGQKALSILLDQINNNVQEVQHVILPVHLIKR